MTHEGIARDLRAFIAEQFLNGKDEGLEADTMLLELGIIDSVSLMMILAFIKGRYGVDVPAKEVRPTNVKTIDAMAEMVLRLSTG
jgi:clorobiocin biosynthesis protein CloN5